MTSFSSICIVWISFCVGLVSAQTKFTVSGSVGSTAVLPCELKSPDTETPHIEWRINSKNVFERRGKEFYQGEGYEGRVDVPEDQLRKGNCSLELKDLKLTDKAEYKSYRIVRRNKRDVSVDKELDRISRVTLSVTDKETSVPEAPPPLDAAGMKCPHPLSMVLSLLSSLLFHFFLKHTGV